MGQLVDEAEVQQSMPMERSVFSYVAYGLGIHSVLPLPELASQKTAADVVIRLGPVDCSRLEVVDTNHRFWADPEQACHYFDGVGAFLVRGGREIVVDPIPTADERSLRLSLLGPALALALHQRGKFVLHASAVAVTGGAIAFLGGHGWGKSTLAATFHARGHEMIADDVTAVHLDGGSPTVVPSFPQLKLWPDALLALGEAPEALPLLHPDFVKRARRVTEGFATTPVPLKRLYVLARGDTLAIETLQPREGMQELLQHWYGARFGRQLIKAARVPALFLQCASLANSVPVRRLQKPHCLATLADAARMVMEDLSGGI